MRRSRKPSPSRPRHFSLGSTGSTRCLWTSHLMYLRNCSLRPSWSMFPQRLLPPANTVVVAHQHLLLQHWSTLGFAPG
jgi:hypothetical protein